MKPLYELTADMQELMDSEEVTETQLQQVFTDITVKAASICQVINQLEADAAMFKAEEDRISARRKAMENRAKQIKDYLKHNMDALGIDSLAAGTFKITLAATAGTLEVTDENAIPGCYKTVVQSVTIDKNAIKKAIASGSTVAGCQIVPGKSICIR